MCKIMNNSKPNNRSDISKDHRLGLMVQNRKFPHFGRLIKYQSPYYPVGMENHHPIKYGLYLYSIPEYEVSCVLQLLDENHCILTYIQAYVYVQDTEVEEHVNLLQQFNDLTYNYKDETLNWLYGFKISEDTVVFPTHKYISIGKSELQHVGGNLPMLVNGIGVYNDTTDDEKNPVFGGCYFVTYNNTICLNQCVYIGKHDITVKTPVEVHRYATPDGRVYGFTVDTHSNIDIFTLKSSDIDIPRHNHLFGQLVRLGKTYETSNSAMVLWYNDINQRYRVATHEAVFWLDEDECKQNLLGRSGIVDGV